MKQTLVLFYHFKYKKKSLKKIGALQTNLQTHGLTQERCELTFL